MIELRPNGIQDEDLETIVGRIVMVDALLLFTAFKGPARVLSVSKKTMEVIELGRVLDRNTNELTYIDENRNDSQPTSLQLRTAKLICDTADEVNAIRDLREKITQEHTAFVKAVPQRFLQLAQELSVEAAPKGP